MTDLAYPILDPATECASAAERMAAAGRAWEAQRERVARSDFYGAKLKGFDVGSVQLGDISVLPFTTKQELQQTQEESPPFGTHLAVDPGDVARRYETSGTSGRRMVVALTSADVESWMAIGRRSYHAMGVGRATTVLSTFDPQPYVVGFTHEVVASLGAAVVAPGLRNTQGAVDAVRSQDIDVLLSTPSTAVYLVARLRDEGIDPGALGLDGIILGGEPGAGPGPLRTRLERVFGAPVVEAMGIGDVAPSLFAECAAGTGMHFMGDGLVWLEIVDAEGKPLPLEAGVSGELVYTHLRREGMPLVRFRSRDVIRVVTSDCPCERTSIAIRAEGRTDDMFIVRGVNVYPSAVQAVVAEAAEEATGRIRLRRSATASVMDVPPLVAVELSPGAVPGKGLADRIAAAIHDRLHFRTEVRLVPSGEFGDAHYKSGFLDPDD